MKDVEVFDHLEDLDQEWRYLIHKAKEATQHAHANYSKFCVGAALMLEDGTLVTGSNYENASYPLSMCAERVALYAAAASHPDKRITRMVVVARKKGGKDLVPATSCGGCRQVMLEFEGNQKKPIEILMQTEDHRWVKVSSSVVLLPYAFSRHALDKDIRK
jgi:cytidine deaminase